MGLYNRVESVPLLKNQKHLHQSKPQKKPRALSKLNALPAVYNTASPLLLNAPHVRFLKEVFTIRDRALHNMGRNHERKIDHFSCNGIRFATNQIVLRASPGKAKCTAIGRLRVLGSKVIFLRVEGPLYKVRLRSWRVLWLPCCFRMA